MKKTILFSLLLALSLALAACGGNTTPASQAATDTQGGPNARELGLSTKLAIGTLKLEKSDLAVTPDQAAKLLPLWQVFSNLSSSTSAAPEEVTAVTEQIQETMTAEQLKAINDMNLTGQDIFSTMQELGLANAPQLNASGTPEPGRNFQGGRMPEGGFPPGGGPQGGPPDGGPGGGFGGQGLSQEQIATAQARRAEGGGGFGNRMMTPLVDAVIKLLESKTGS